MPTCIWPVLLIGHIEWPQLDQSDVATYIATLCIFLNVPMLVSDYFAQDFFV